MNSARESGSAAGGAASRVHDAHGRETDERQQPLLLLRHLLAEKKEPISIGAGRWQLSCTRRLEGG